MELGDAQQKVLSTYVGSQLVELMGEEDAVMLEYIMTMVTNKKNMGEMQKELTTFFEGATAGFVDGLYDVLVALE